MKIAIMQPYLFPYIGYFQLINIADKFVIHDDVQYIKGGWINRNRILVNGTDFLFTFSIKNDSTFLNINQRYFTENFDKDKIKFLKIIESAYGKAPFYTSTKNLLDFVLSINEKNISKMIMQSLIVISNYLDINTEFYMSSVIHENNTLKGEERVIHINQCLKSNHYINSIGGQNLYSQEKFEKHGMKLSFLQPKLVEYHQLDNQFIPWLSIIDVLMFNDKNKVKKMLNEYTLIT